MIISNNQNHHHLPLDKWELWQGCWCMIELCSMLNRWIHGDNLDHLGGFRIRIWISVMTVLWTNDNLSVRKKEKNKVDSCDCRARRSQMWCSFGMEQGWNAKMVHRHALGFWLFYVVLLFAVPVTVTTVLWSYHNSWTFRILRFPQCPPSFSFYIGKIPPP